MEITFKNRPHPNIDINPAEEGLALELVHREKDGSTPAKVYLAKSSAMVLANSIRSYLSDFHQIQTGDGLDKIEVSGGGTDAEPTVFVWVQHHSQAGEEIRRAFHISESEASTLAKALELWGKSA